MLLYWYKSNSNNLDIWSLKLKYKKFGKKNPLQQYSSGTLKSNVVVSKFS